MGYSVIASKKDNLSVTQTSFVPLHHNCEVHRVVLKNEGTTAKDIKLFSFVEFCLWNAFDDMTNFQRNYSIGEVEVEGSAIYHKTEYRERRNHYAVFAVNAPLAGFDTDRETFMGLYNGFDHPDAVFAGESRNSIAPRVGPHWFPLRELHVAARRRKELHLRIGVLRKPEGPEMGKARRDQQSSRQRNALLF